MTQFNIRLQRVQDCDLDEPQKLYVIVAETDQTGHQEGDIWIPIEALPQLVSDLQTYLTPMEVAA